MAELKDSYANELFELSRAQEKLAEHTEQVTFILDSLQKEEYKSFLEAPHFSENAKQQLLERLFADNVSDDLLGFLYRILQKGHGAMIVPALLSYLEMGNRYSGKVVASVISAAPLSDGPINTLRKTLAHKSGKQVEILPTVDPSLLGGFRIHMDGRLMDCSLRARLTNLKESLLKEGTE